MIEKIKFAEVNLSMRGPFAEAQYLRLPDGLVTISSGNGMGKTTTFNILIENFHLMLENPKIKNELKILKEIIFLNDYSLKPSEGLQQKILNILNSTHVDTNRYLSTLSEYLCKIMRPKFGQKYNKFSSRAEALQPPKIRLEIAEPLKIYTQEEEDVSYLFQAHSEEIAVLFSSNLALRKLLNLEYPLVCDMSLSGGDSDVLSGLLNVLKEEPIQIIIMEHPSFWENLQIKPTIEFILDLQANHTIVKT